MYGEPAPVRDKLKAARRNGWTMEKAKDYIKKLKEKSEQGWLHSKAWAQNDAIL